MKRVLLFLKKYYVLTVALTVALCYASVKVLSSEEEIDANGIFLRILLTIVCGAVLYVVSGSKSFENLDKDIGYTLSRYKGFLIFSFLLGASALIASIAGGVKLVDGWPKVLFMIIVEVIFVGLFEELCFRVIINDALLYRFRDNKYIFVWIAVITTFLFGWVHVASATATTPIAIAQAALKTISSGLMGLGLLILYWKTHNFWAIAIAHALYDFFPLVGAQLFDHGIKAGNYITEGTQEIEGVVVNMGATQAGVYAVQTVLCIIFDLVLIKVIKSTDFDEIRKTW